MILAIMLAAQTMIPTAPRITRVDMTTAARRAPMSIANGGSTLPALIDIRITSPEGLDWRDTLRVDQNSGASYSQNRSESPAVPCGPNSSYERARRTSLTVQLNLRQDSDRGPMVAVSLDWKRPSIASDCQPAGTRGIEIEQAVPLAAGETATIVGDGGLRVTLTRR